MSTSKEYIEFVCDQIQTTGEVRYKKMFGEYMVYINDKPILLVCDDTVFIKMHDAIKDIMSTSDTGHPYDGAKLHYVLDIDDTDLCREVVGRLEEVTPVPKKRKK